MFIAVLYMFYEPVLIYTYQSNINVYLLFA